MMLGRIALDRVDLGIYSIYIDTSFLDPWGSLGAGRGDGMQSWREIRAGPRAGPKGCRGFLDIFCLVPAGIPS